MSKRKYRYAHSVKTRRDREIKQQQREIVEANRVPAKENVEDAEDAPADYREDYEDWVPDGKKKWYVLDTNLILGCVDVIPDVNDENWRPPLNFLPVLDNAHLIIPEVVFDELDRIKEGHTVNRATARVAMKRFLKFFPNSERTMYETLNLARPVRTGWKNQTISLLPLHRNFAAPLPYAPKENDNDGWIALTALAATMIRDGLPVDGTVSANEMLERKNSRRDVVLLTQDNPLRSKATNYAVRTRSYSFDARPPFTGRRDLTVPAEMFEKFYYDKILTREEFERYLPNELPLVANEYIVMTPENSEYPISYSATERLFPNIARYDKENGKLYPLEHVKKEGITPPNAGIATYYDAMNDSKAKVIAVSGMAGTGKTYQIVVHALRVIDKGDFTKLVLIVNSEDNGVGYLPGNQEKKLEPAVAFCKDAIRSYLEQTPRFREMRAKLRKHGHTDSQSSRSARRPKDFPHDDDDYMYDCPKGDPHNQHSKKKKRCYNEVVAKEPPVTPKTYYEALDEEVNRRFKRDVLVVPFKQALGRNFNDAIIVLDESQRISIDEMITLITRSGRNTLLVVCGDVNQNKHNSPEKRTKNGFVLTQKLYHDKSVCINVYLTDNMRDKAVDIANQNYDAVMEELYGLET